MILFLKFRAKLLDGFTVADAYLVTAGYHGTVHAAPDAVTVTVRVRRTTLLLGAVGVHEFTVTESGTATPVRGIEAAVP